MRVGNGLSESFPQAVIGPLVLVRQASSDQLGSGSILEGLVTAKRLTDTAALDRRKDAWAEAYRSTPRGQPVRTARTFSGLGDIFQLEGARRLCGRRSERSHDRKVHGLENAGAVCHREVEIIGGAP